MYLAQIDQISNNGESPLHNCRPVSKAVFTLLLITSFIISNDLTRLGIIIGVILCCFAISRVPIRFIGHLVVYPIVFSLIFALIKLQQSWVLASIVLLKAVGAALTMLLLITTTSYTDIFGFLALFLPRLLVDIMVFTYRSLFIMIGMVENLIKSIRLRGGYNPLGFVSNIKNISGALGVLILHSIDMSERMYKIYSLRGYDGVMKLNVDLGPLKVSDYLLLTASMVILVGMVIPWNL